MLDQNLDFENLIIGVISALALVIFVIMLVAAFVSFRSERETRNYRLSRDTLRDALTSTRLILQKYPRVIQTLNWVICLALATYLAWLTYSRELYVINRTSLYPYLVGLGVISPTCLAVAWLRLTGAKWRQALWLFVWVPVAFGGTVLIAQLVSVLLSNLGNGF